jgi:hypothetical protein
MIGRNDWNELLSKEGRFRIPKPEKDQSSEPFLGSWPNFAAARGNGISCQSSPHRFDAIHASNFHVTGRLHPSPLVHSLIPPLTLVRYISICTRIIQPIAIQILYLGLHIAHFLAFIESKST